jgi:hypothetical protein
MSNERKHHEFSPSQLQGLECCPSYQGTNAGNEKARLGTLQHTAAETGEDNAELSDEQATAVAEAMAFVAEQKQILHEEQQRAVSDFMSKATSGDVVKIREAFSDSSPILPVLDLSEVYLPVDAEETTGGYADSLLVSYDRKRAVLTDFKFGQWATESAENNLQGIAYSLGAFFRFPTLEEVAVHFFQPALKTKVNSTVWKRSDVPALLLRVKTVVARAKLARSRGDFQMVNPTVPGCLFCANLALCPAVASLVLRVGHKFHPVECPSEITPSMVHNPANSTMGMRLASLMAAWSAAYKNLTTDRVLRGAAPVPDGYTISQGAGKRKIVDNNKFKTTALEFIPEYVYNASTEPQLGKIEKAIKDAAARGMKDSTVKEFRDKLVENEAVKPGEPFVYLKAKTSSEDSESDDNKE